MCGIAGAVSLIEDRPVESERIHRMLERLIHRGPDSSAVFSDNEKSFGLGFRRLSIIDLETGMQPISNESKTIHLVCNGEIYNFKPLRHLLAARGHQFHTSGDIEPIVHLYEDFGRHFIDQIDGFFSFALYDQNKKCLILAVDRFGKKPLYYTVQSNQLYFASELKALSEVISPAELNKSAIVDYLRFGYIPAPQTVFTDVMKVPPGHLLYISLDYQRKLASQSLPPTVPYYIPDVKPSAVTYPDARTMLSELMSRAVEKRLVADVPVGILLSGGIDSSVITALATKYAPNIKTFSVGFTNQKYNELPLARLLAKKYQTDHHEILVQPDIEQIVDTVEAIYDEPFADSSAIPTHLICKEAAKHVRVVLVGDGGDESFCGYDRYRAIAITTFLSRLKMKPVGKLIERFIPRPGAELRSRKTRFWRLVRALRFSPAKQYSMFMQVFFDRHLDNLLGSELTATYQQSNDFVAQAFAGLTEFHSPVQKANLSDILTYLTGDLLVKMDRASMASSLETRAPFLDRAVVEFGLNLPVDYKCSRREGKTIVRDTFSSLLPKEHLYAPKRGFGVPMGQWLRCDLKNQMTHILDRNSLLVKNHFVDNVYLVRLIAEHLNCMFDHSARLWSLMVLEKFLKKNL